MNNADFSGKVLSATAVAEAPKPPNCLEERCLALTFDDGPNPQTTPLLLAALEAEAVPATFFVVGSRIAGNEALLRQIYNDGDELGNHSWSHPDFTKLKPPAMLEQVNRTETAVITAGLPPPRLFRPPYGTRNQTMRDTIHLPIILWNIDPRDWSETNASKITKLVERQARAGGIMILHDSHAPTAAAAYSFIHYLNMRYRLVTVSELLDLRFDARGEFFGHPLR
jgi:peptidoglycan/xylan/chitin deacetylase (PgdA/CDA1 family)